MTPPQEELYSEIQQSKICASCGTPKLLSEFNKRGGARLGLRNQCKACDHIDSKAAYEAKKEKESVRKREYRIKHRDAILAKESELRKENREQIIATRKRWEKNNPHKVSATRARFRENHPHYSRDANRAKRSADPDLTRKELSDYHFSKFGVDQDWYDRTLASQGYGCMICGRPDSGIEGKRFHIDHDHSCCGPTKACDKCRRGLLCLRCNTWISQLERHPFIVKRSVWYLEKFKNKQEATSEQYPLFNGADFFAPLQPSNQTKT